MKRRPYLSSIAAASAILAGCSGDGESDETDEGSDDEETTDPTANLNVVDVDIATQDVEQGEPIDLTVTVDNTGSREAETSIELTLDSDTVVDPGAEPTAEEVQRRCSRTGFHVVTESVGSRTAVLFDRLVGVGVGPAIVGRRELAFGDERLAVGHTVFSQREVHVDAGVQVE